MNVLFVAAVSTLLLCAVQGGPFAVKISTKSEGDDVTCEVTITNTQDKDYFMLKRYTPLEGLISPLFSITRDGEMVPYDGILVKRGPPSEDDYVRIRAKTSVLSSVDLSEAYSFNSAGPYKVNLQTKITFFADRSTNSSTQLVVSNFQELSFIQNINQSKLTRGEVARRTVTLNSFSLKAESARVPKFDGRYSSSDMSTATTAYTAAYNVLYKSAQSVTGKPSLYKTWFGTAYSGYMNTVQGNYLSIKSAMERYTFTLYFHGSGCKRNTYAYTYKGTTTVYLCDVYFLAPTLGSNSKMGTIVHEMSHAVAYTDDTEYGEQDCQYLARNSPSKAIKNADNYEYFSESQ